MLDIFFSDLLNQTWVSFSSLLTNFTPHLAHRGILSGRNCLTRFFTLHSGQGIMLEVSSFITCFIILNDLIKPLIYIFKKNDTS
jgi:hypothetical protein